jgi:hypothetical protein
MPDEVISNDPEPIIVEAAPEIDVAIIVTRTDGHWGVFQITPETVPAIATNQPVQVNVGTFPFSFQPSVYDILSACSHIEADAAAYLAGAKIAEQAKLTMERAQRLQKLMPQGPMGSVAVPKPGLFKQ